MERKEDESGGSVKVDIENIISHLSLNIRQEVGSSSEDTKQITNQDSELLVLLNVIILKFIASDISVYHMTPNEEKRHLSHIVRNTVTPFLQNL